MIWDIAGQKAFESVHQAYYRGSEAGLIVADITKRETLEHIPKWIMELYEVVGKVPVLLLVNKFDLDDQFAFGEKEIKQVLSNFAVNYLYTSAKTAHNVEKSFKELSKLILKEM